MKKILFIIVLLFCLGNNALMAEISAFAPLDTVHITKLGIQGQAIYTDNPDSVITHSGTYYFKTKDESGKTIIEAWDVRFTANNVGSEGCYVKIIGDTMLKTKTDTVITLTTQESSPHYKWFAVNPDDEKNISGDKTSNTVQVTVHPLQTVQYVLQTMEEDYTNIVFNGDFEEGKLGFWSDYGYVSTKGGTALWDEGKYTVGDNPNDYHSNFSNFAGSEYGNMLIANGAPGQNKIAYASTFDCEPHVNYIVMFDAANISNSDESAIPRFQFAVNGVQLGDVFKISAKKDTWTKDFYEIWYSGDDTLATITILNQNTAKGGNDFTIDNIRFYKMCTAYDTITIVNDTRIRETVNVTLCEGETYQFNGKTVEEQGTYIDTLKTEIGMDSIITLHLNVNPVYEVNLDTTICEQQSIDFNGQRLYAAGVYTAVLPTMEGCDSVVHIKVNVSEKSYKTIDTTIYAWVTYNFIDSLINDDGTYVKILPNAAGCDSVITLNLRYDDKIYINRIMCEGETYQLGSRTITSTGVYSDTLTALNGNDSIIVLSLTVYPNYNDTIFAKIGAGTVYERDGFYESTSGIYEHDSKTVNGCDSLVVLVLEAEDPIDIWAPNAIIPNGDGGENRVFKVYPSSEDIVIESLQIYNRWGGLIFETEDINKGWDGKYKGSVCQNGTYIYTVNYYRKGKEGKKYRKTGEVNIIG